MPPAIIKQIFKLVAVFGLLAALTAGCYTPSSQNLWQETVSRGGPAGFKAITFDRHDLKLAGHLKMLNPGADLVVYLEGDGRAVVGGYPSSDPTPRTPTAFHLALNDPAPRVLYLARVGQYLPEMIQPRFVPYWSDKRLARESMEAASRAIDQAKAECGAQKIHLIGYSGGGGLAVLLGENRSDVASLVTVAGLLDTKWWCDTQHYRPLNGSLNPADGAALIAGLKQIHFFGQNDKIIKPAMSERFKTLTEFVSFQRVGLPLDHWQGWDEAWPGLLQKYVLPSRF